MMEVNSHELAFVFYRCGYGAIQIYHLIQVGVCDAAWILMQKHLHANKFEHSGRTSSNHFLYNLNILELL